MSVTESTNADLLEEARNGASGGLVEVADHQTAGRGRQGRNWLDGGDGQAAMMSCLLRPSVPNDRLGVIPLATGLAVLDAMRNLGASDVWLKWPNDVLWVQGDQQGKVAGILAESILGSSGPAVVIGIGINLQPPPASPATQRAVGLSQLVGVVPARDDVVMAVLRALDTQLDLLERGDWSLDRYRSCCITLGTNVDLDTPSGQLSGAAVDVAEDGQLVIDCGGQLVPVWAGDVHHRVT